MASTKRWTVLVACILCLPASIAFGEVDALAREQLSSDDFDRHDPWHPEEAGLPWAPFKLSREGLTVRGWHVPAAGSDSIVILVHGHAGTMGDAGERWAPMLHAAGHHVLAFDLPGHGSSDGQGVTYGPREADFVRATAGIIKGGIFDPDIRQVALMGGSMGAVVVLLAAAEVEGLVDAVIADSPYPSFAWQAARDGAEAGYPQWLIDLVIARMDAVAAAPPSQGDAGAAARTLHDRGVPLMLAHCTDDERIDFAAHAVMLEAAPSAATWTGPCPTGLSPHRHVDGWMHADYNATVLGLLEQAFSPAGP